MSIVRVTIEPDDDMTFGELEEVRKAVATFMVITHKHIQLDDGSVFISGFLVRQSNDADSKAR